MADKSVRAQRESPAKKLVEAINESAKQISAATLTLLIVCVYIGIAVASTTDEVLLLGRNIGLPLFDVQIPLEQFYALAPALLVFLHLHVLLLQYLLACKVARFVSYPNKKEEETDLFFPSLPISILLRRQEHEEQGHTGTIRFLLWMLLITVSILPVALLVVTQVKFLPYHSAGITAWHKILILLDLALIWYFFLRTPSPVDEDQKSSKSDELQVMRLRSIPVALGALATLGVVGLIASGPATGYDFAPGHRFQTSLQSLFTGVISQNISLPEYVSTSEPSEEKPQARGSQFVGRDLRGAEFTGASLVNADFRGADLANANFENADLRGAKFTPLGGASELREALSEDSSHEMLNKARAKKLSRVASLRGANLRGAKLQNADLFMADLRKANLERTHLDGADLSLADLKGARLRGAFLNGAKLRYSIANHTDLRETELLGADLSGASLIGADLWRSKLQASNLQNADLRMAKLVEVEAAAADFSAASVKGADLRSGKLYSVTGLALQGVDLRGAHLGLSWCGERDSLEGPTPGERILKFLPEAIDFRLINFEDLAEKEWKKVEDEVRSKISSEVTQKIVAARLEQRAKEPCSVILRQLDPNAPRGLLYDASRKPELIKSWTVPQLLERDYHAELAPALVDEACGDHELAEALVQDLSGELSPRRPLLTKAIASKILEYLREGPKLKARCPALGLIAEERRSPIDRAVRERPLRGDD